MKITLVCDILGNEDNGTTITTMNLLRHLQKNNEVRVLCCDPSKKGLPNFYVTERKHFPGSLQTFVDKTGFALAKPDKKIVEEAVAGADVVHCLEPFALSIAAIKAAKKHHIPVCASVHLLPEHLTSYVHFNYVPFVNFSIYRYWWHKVYKKVNAIHYPTPFTKILFHKKARAARKKLEYVISNGVDLLVKPSNISKPKEFENKIIILCSGRFAPEKSQITLINAVKRSRFKDKIQLIFAGKGQQLEKLKDKSSTLPNKPIFARYKHNKLMEILNYSDLYIHPAIIETEGIAVLEAITCGKLVIVSNARKSAPKTFGLPNDCIFKARNSRALAKTIDYWIKKPQLKASREKNNAFLGKQYNLNNCMKLMEQMLVEIRDKSME